MNWDVIGADVLVWLMTNALWIVAVGAALVLGLALSPRRPEQQRPDDSVNEAYRPTYDDMAGLIWRADWERTQREAAEAELRRLQGRLRAVDDAVRCAELELGWDRP